MQAFRSSRSRGEHAAPEPEPELEVEIPARWAADGAASLDPLWRLLAEQGEQAHSAPGITQLAHGLRCAALASEAGAGDALLLAAGLHDVGHLLQADFEAQAAQAKTDRHHLIGAAFLALWFGPEVTEPVRLHVEARRFLCASEPGYCRRLKSDEAGRRRSMSAEECRRFLALAHAREAILLRRWDDRANREPVAGLPFARFKALAERLAFGRG